MLLKKDELRSARDMIKVPPFYRHPLHKTVVNMVERNDELPRLPGMMSGKRGPGRPKKTPPTLEPILPLSKHGGGLLNDICERVKAPSAPSTKLGMVAGLRIYYFDLFLSN